MADGKSNIEFSLPELNNSKVITWTCYVDKSDEIGYDMIIGQDLMREIGISLDFKNALITWDDLKSDMRFNHMKENHTIISQSEEPKTTQEMTARVTRILDSKYEKANLEQISKNASHLSLNEQKQLYQVLKKHETLFDGTLGTWNTEPVGFTMKEEAKPHSHQYYSTPRIH